MAHLLLKLISGGAQNQDNSFRFSHLGGTIGRSETCDWTLLDPDRFVSKSHALISYENNHFVLTDTSTNGVFINSTNQLLGQGQKHTIQATDTIIIGQYQFVVQEIECSHSSAMPQQESGDLLNMVMGSEQSSAQNAQSLDPLALLGGDNSSANSQNTGSDLGLNDILSGSPVASGTPAAQPSYQSFNANSDPFSDKQEFVQPQTAKSVAEATSIPDDWELSGIMPAIKDFDANDVQPPSSSQPFIEEAIPDFVPETAAPQTPDVEPLKQTPVQEQTLADLVNTSGTAEPSHYHEPAPVEPIAPVFDEAIVPPVTEATPELNEAVVPVVPNVPPRETALKPEKAQSIEVDEVKSKPNTKQAVQDDFFNVLYEKLGLPKEYIDTVDKEAFAEDIATVLVSTTQGLMSLLGGRAIFKQESRLSLTSVQPRSNNPIKFSIDPTDTLEMLLLKKKSGYLSAKESYDEAVNDIQLHQMAFIAGLQATLTGVLNQISPDKIDAQAKENGRSFMGLNAASQSWQLYKDKHGQQLNAVSQNLNEVLSNHFADAYQAQINNIKNNKG